MSKRRLTKREKVIRDVYELSRMIKGVRASKEDAAWAIWHQDQKASIEQAREEVERWYRGG